MKNLRLLREKRKFSQEKLAKLLYVTQQAVCKYENGHSEANFKTLSRMSEIFHIPVEYLIDDTLDIEQYRMDADILLSSSERSLISGLRNLDDRSRNQVIDLCNKLMKSKKDRK